MSDDLEKYLDLLFGGLKGYVYSPVKHSDKPWEQKFFDWPSESSLLQNHIKENSNLTTADVYISPVVYSDRSADKASVKGGKTVWVEFDGKERIDFRNLPIPDAIVQSSLSTHLHCYWEVEPNVKEVIEQTNKRLTYYLLADSSGWDATQLLRPPGSINRKRDLPVQLVSFDRQGARKLESFSAAPEVAVRESTFAESSVRKAIEVLQDYTLPVSLIRQVKIESPGEPGRSSFLTKVAFELAEEGVKRDDVISLLLHVDERIKKYSGRSDRMLRLCQIADLAVHKVTVDDQILLYTPQDILDHVEDLQWILPGWLHTSGQLMVSSAPGVGKTQLTIQLLTQLLSKQSFLGRKGFKDIPHSTLFLSLEMDVSSLKYIFGHQKAEWTDSFQNNNFHVMDEHASLTKYEDLIAETKATVVLIDSLVELLDDVDEENPNVAGRKAMRWCRKVRRRYGCAIILVHHNRKATDSNKKPKSLSDLAGTFSFAKDSDTVIVLWEDHKGIELSTPKIRFGIKEEFMIERNDNLWFKRVEKDASGESETNGESPTGSPAFGTSFGGH
jgi:KaiC/GvpD/RAD55 family RecA-like ATPase